MHEMSLAESVVQIVEDYAREGGFKRVRMVRLEIGPFAGVEEDAMRFCFDAVSRSTVAEGAQLEIVSPPGSGWCMKCGETVSLAQRYDACPRCGGYQVQVTGGTELRVKELEVE